MSDLIEQVANINNLQLAWSKIRHKAKSKGYDDQTILDFKHNLSSNLLTIRAELLSKNYTFQKLLGATIKKDNGKFRGLRIPAVRDRVVQKAIELVVREYLEIKYRTLNPASFAYREGYSVKDAIDQVRFFYSKKNLRWVFVGDIQNFFDAVDTTILLKDFIYPALPDTSIHKLLSDVLALELGNRTELNVAGYSKYFPIDGIGIPQGGVLSPLFANVYLSPLDKAMIDNKFHLVRYADDFLVMCTDEAEAKSAYLLANQTLKDLKLNLHPLFDPTKFQEKISKIEQFGQQEFLGIKFNQSKIRPGTKNCREMISLLKNFNKKLPCPGLTDNLKYLSMRTQAWGATYYYTDYQKDIYDELDNQLLIATGKLIKKFGFTPTTGRFREYHLNKLGIYTFTKKFQQTKAKKSK